MLQQQTKAQDKAKKSFRIHYHDTKIGKLYWLERTKKSKKVIYPVREASVEETSFLALGDWDPDEKTGIQYIQYPHEQISGANMSNFEVVSNNLLTPYYGVKEDSNKQQWCAAKFEQYSKQLKRSHKGMNAVDIKTEEVFLQCILQKSLEEGEQEKQSAKVDDAIPNEDIDSDDEKEQAANDSDEDGSDDEADEATGKRRTRGSTSGLQERTERLRPHDRIGFYQQQMTAGDARAYVEATILYIDPKSDTPLQLDDAFINLEANHQVKRVQRYERGKLVNNSGVFRSISKYILKKEGDPNALSKVLAGNKARTDEIIQRRKAEAIKKMKKDGFCPEDMIR